MRNDILQQIVDDPHIAFRVKIDDKLLFRYLYGVFHPPILQERDPINHNITGQLCRFSSLYCHGKFIGIELKPVEQDINIVFQLIGFPPGRLNVLLPLRPGNNALMHCVQIPDQRRKGCPQIMGKARHKLFIRFLCLLKGRNPILIGADNIIDLIEKRGEELTGIGKDTAVSVPASHVRQSFGKLFDLPPFPVQNESGGYRDNRADAQEKDD